MLKEKLMDGCKIHGPKDICKHTTTECPDFLYARPANDGVERITEEAFDVWTTKAEEIYYEIEELKNDLHPSQIKNSPVGWNEFLNTHKSIASLSYEAMCLRDYLYKFSGLSQNQEKLADSFFFEMQQNFLTSKKTIEEFSETTPTA